MPSTHYVTSGTTSADLMNTTSSANRANGIGQMFALGQRAAGNNNSQWQFVYASAAITQYAVVGVEASGTASMLTSTTARATTAVSTLGIAQVAFSAGDYGWIATEGSSLVVLTTAVSTAGERLYTTSTAGRVSTAQATAADAGISGLRLTTTTTGAGATSAAAVAQNLVLTYPALLTT